MNWFRRLRLVITHGPEIEQLANQLRGDREAREREENKHRLNLCYKHRQEANRSHYAEHNCHYCQLQEELSKHKAITDYYADRRGIAGEES